MIFYSSQLGSLSVHLAGSGEGLSGSQQLSRHSTGDSHVSQEAQPCELPERSVDAFLATANLNIRMPSAAPSSTSCDSALSATPDSALVGFSHVCESAPPVVELLGILPLILAPPYGFQN